MDVVKGQMDVREEKLKRQEETNMDWKLFKEIRFFTSSFTYIFFLSYHFFNFGQKKSPK